MNLFQYSAYAYQIPKLTTPNYKVAFYAFDCYHMTDANGKRYGYGYDMMQNVSNYMQCTFSYVGYDKSAAECVDMLRNGELDIYTAARKTPEREAEFAFSTHPAITASTCMNIKVGNKNITAGDYSTYDGLKIGLLKRHTYNNSFSEWAQSKGFSYEIKYYETPTELSKALIDGEVDALVNSYIGTPKDEYTIENFGETPYYIMARKENQNLIDEIDAAIDKMNIEIPNWRTDLYNEYYGVQALNTELSDAEKELLAKLKTEDTVIRAVLAPDSAPYSYYENGEYKGITVEIFKAAAERLGLKYEFVPSASKEEYINALNSGEADVWLDADSENPKIGNVRYRTTNPYLQTSVSVLRKRRANGKIQKLAVLSNDITTKEIIAENWPDAEIIAADTTEECVKSILSDEADGALLVTYTAQKLAQDDIQNKFRTDIVQNSYVDLRMGVNADIDRDFFGIWSKTLAVVSNEIQDDVVQKYVETSDEVTWIQYLFDHPVILALLAAAVLASIFFAVLYTQSVKSRNKQKAISDELSIALENTKAATKAKNEFFSKMSHDIRTPLNAVLGMSQIAQKYKNDPERLNEALDSISSEGHYLLMLINSIMDVNQLEYGHLELNNAPFDLVQCMRENIGLMQMTAQKNNRELYLSCNFDDAVVVGDEGRFSQIVINIVSNGLKYTEDGGHVYVSLEKLPDNRYRFVCKDDGIGMSEEFLQHITEEYVRAEDSRISKVHGTGLGMAIVEGLTQLMGGTLLIESELGKGSVFTVELPFEPAAPQQRAEILKSENEVKEEQQLAGKHVLMAEDNEINAEIAMELLKTIGITVDWVENGAFAVEKFESSEPGTYYAIFMDMQMPIMNGLEATACIRSGNHADKDIPIIAMTANIFDADKKSCMDAGMSGFVSKPVDIEKIVEALLKIKK